MSHSPSTKSTSSLGPRDPWIDRISHSRRIAVVEVESPYGVPVYLTPRQHMVLVWVGRGKRITQRQHPEAIGYSLTGFHQAIVQLRRLGLVGHVARRGCRGSTRLWRNVRTMSSPRKPRYLLPLPLPQDVVRTFDPPPPPKPRLGRLEEVDGKWVVSPDTVSIR